MRKRDDKRPAPLLEVRGLRRSFRRPSGRSGRDAPVTAVDGIDLTVDRGEILGIAGESGSGKSTLARLIVRLLATDAGEILFQGVSVSAADAGRRLDLRRRIQLVFQDPSAALSPRRSVRQSLFEPLEHFGLCAPYEREARAVAALEETGLGPDIMGRRPHHLSSGQKQRVCIARALLAQPDLIVADEPVSALDVSVQAQILQLLARLRTEHGMGVLLISHDLAVVHQLADRAAIMLFGRIVESGPTGELFANPAHPYTRELLTAVPDPDPRRPWPPVTGAAGLRRGPAPSGCPYHARCPEALDRCATEPPAERQVAPGPHRVQCHLYPNA